MLIPEKEFNTSLNTKPDTKPDSTDLPRSNVNLGSDSLEPASLEPESSESESSESESSEAQHSTKPKVKRVRGKDLVPCKSGPDHGLYKHGQGKNRPYDSRLYGAWMEGVYQKDDFKCVISGSTSNLSAHHLESVDNNPDKMYEISNGVALRKDIHDEFHNLFGRGNNTREQFERFARENYGIQKFAWQQGNHDPSFTLQDIVERQKTQKERKQEKLFQLIQDRNHKLISAGDEFTTRAFIEVYCPVHKCSHPTTVHNYRRSVTGLPCCGRQSQSDKGSWEIVNQMRKAERDSDSESSSES